MEEAWIIKNTPGALNHFIRRVYNNKSNVSDPNNILDFIKDQASVNTSKHYFLMKIDEDNEWEWGEGKTPADYAKENDYINKFNNNISYIGGLYLFNFMDIVVSWHFDIE